ncbi:MAG TPA: DUF3606 domain-containing protein [Polyangia bacterium]
MSDDQANRGAQDRSRVNINQPHEVRYWSERFGCSEQELRDVVARVGPVVKDVEAALLGSAGSAARQ